MNLDPNKYEVVSFTLGVADESPVAMADAYATFAARGVYCPATPVDPDPRPRRQADPAAARAVQADHAPRLCRCRQPASCKASCRATAPAPRSTSTSRRPARRARRTTSSRCGSSATPRTWRPRVSWPGSRPTLLPRSLTGVTMHGNYISFAYRWRNRRTDLAAGDAGDRAVPARPALRAAGPQRSSRARPSRSRRCTATSRLPRPRC